MSQSQFTIDKFCLLDNRVDSIILWELKPQDYGVKFFFSRNNSRFESIAKDDGIRCPHTKHYMFVVLTRVTTFDSTLREDFDDILVGAGFDNFLLKIWGSVGKVVNYCYICSRKLIIKCHNKYGFQR